MAVIMMRPDSAGGATLPAAMHMSFAGSQGNGGKAITRHVPCTAHSDLGQGFEVWRLEEGTQGHQNGRVRGESCQYEGCFGTQTPHMQRLHLCAHSSTGLRCSVCKHEVCIRQKRWMTGSEKVSQPSDHVCMSTRAHHILPSVQLHSKPRRHAFCMFSGSAKQCRGRDCRAEAFANTHKPSMAAFSHPGCSMAEPMYGPAIPHAMLVTATEQAMFGATQNLPGERLRLRAPSAWPRACGRSPPASLPRCPDLHRHTVLSPRAFAAQQITKAEPVLASVQLC